MTYLFTCQFEKVPPEILTVKTLKKSVPGVPESYKQCIYLKGLVNKVRDDCQKQLQTKCPERVQTSLENNCHQYLEAAHGGGSHFNSPGFPSVNSYRQCIQGIQARFVPCLDDLKRACLLKKVKGAKILRSHLDFTEELMKDFPNLKVVHLLRDPRAILNSRRKSDLQVAYKSSIIEEAKYLCQNMLHDMQLYKQLKHKYPDIYLQIRYEDFANSPMQVLQGLYRHFEMSLPDYVQRFIFNVTHDS